ncbi:hypothetical protein [Kibdelosporangium philippinense]|uniref:hypothetical protein n=1 Tax=Kibdelosporangium philippinense TaxID=211113 RepID=UPI00360C048C
MANGTTVTSPHVTRTVANPADSDTLVVADGADPKTYVDALAGDVAVWDVRTQGAPDALGVLSHFKTVVWAVGFQAANVATTLAVRDYLNEGGRVVQGGLAARTDRIHRNRCPVRDHGLVVAGHGRRIHLNQRHPACRAVPAVPQRPRGNVRRGTRPVRALRRQRIRRDPARGQQLCTLDQDR